MSDNVSNTRFRYLWSNDDCPDLDPVRALLAYLYIIGWKGGNLFPSFDELRNPPPDGVYLTKLSDADMYTTLNKIYKHVLNRVERLGSHTGRKTAYLFACMQGCTDMVSLMDAADHSCVTVALKYMRDAQAIAAVNRCYNDPNQHVGTWRNPYSAGGENAVIAPAIGAAHHRPLGELAVGFIEQRVGISPAHPHHRQPKYVFERVMAWQKSRPNASRQLVDELRLISVDRSQVIMSCVRQMVLMEADRATKDALAEAERAKAVWQHEAERAKAVWQQAFAELVQSNLISEGGIDANVISVVSQAFQNALQANIPSPGPLYALPTLVRGRSDAPDDADAAPASKKAKCRKGDKELPVATNFGRWTAADKLVWIDEHADYNSGDYIESSRHKLNRINKVAKCFRGCCQRDHAVFLAKHGKKNGKGVVDFVITKLKPCGTCHEQNTPV